MGPPAFQSDFATAGDPLLSALCGLLLQGDLARAVSEVGRALAGDAALLLRGADAGATWRVAGGDPAVALTRADDFGRQGVWGAPVLHEALRGGQELRLSDVSQLPEESGRALWRTHGVSAVLAVPVPAPAGAVEDSMLAVAWRSTPSGARWDEALGVLRWVAGPLALALAPGGRLWAGDAPRGLAPKVAEELTHWGQSLADQIVQGRRRLAESERRYRRLTEHSTDMISAHDSEGRFTYVSQACRTLLGYAAEDLVGTRPRELAHPEDRDALIRSHQRVRDTEGEVRYTWRGLHRDGREVWLESASRNHGPELVVVTREVGGRLEAELLLKLVRSAVEQVNEGVVITDGNVVAPGPKIVYVNPAFTKMTGYAEHELLGQSPRLLQGAETDIAVLTRIRRSLRRGEASEGETTNYRRDGSTYLAHWSVHPVRDGAGNLTHWVSVQRDASERRADEALERRHREELAHVTRLSMMGELASGLAHEINQPLTTISTYVEGLLTRAQRKDLAQDVLLDILGRVADQAGVASQIIRRLRSFVLKREIVRADASVNDLVYETLALLDADLKQRGVQVRTEVAAGVPKVLVDTIQIQQVLINLIRNAVEASETPLSEAESARVVEVVIGPDGAHGVRIDVVDRGGGLSPQCLDRIFEPFFSTKDGGMGMGLTISRSILEAHGGRLWATANPGRGCTFSMTLPALAHAGAEKSQTGI